MNVRRLRRQSPRPDSGAPQRRPGGRGRRVGQAGLVAFLGAAAASLLISAFWPEPAPYRMTLTQLEGALSRGTIEEIVLDDQTRTADVVFQSGRRARAVYPADYGPVLTRAADRAGAEVSAEAPRNHSLATSLVTSLLPLVIILFFVTRLMRGRMGVGNFSGGRGEQADVPSTRFTDVAGAAEATGELQEIVEYLSDPKRYERVGARPPRGVLLCGPPGTGKTLLARAVAGEAGVPFFALSGSDFTEVFVGVGASRVRKLFDKARAAGRAIVFIDEIDAVGKRRSAHATGGTEEREQTLNQLLVELDGFTTDTQIVLLAATNRPDILDPALTRPGRFDRQIVVGAPDRGGREDILKLYVAAKPVADIDVNALARRTPGFTGADLANLVNQAALAAARDGADRIAQHHFEDAVATVMLGRERRSAQVLERDREITAWHEAGHTVLAMVHPHADDPAGVSIVPRGHAGGVTWMTGNDNQYLTAPQAKARLVVAMGGRAAEVMVYGDMYTQGAGGDLQSATGLATKMAAEYGMSPLIGPVHIPEDQRQLGVNADLLQRAVRDLLNEALAEAQVLLEGNRPLMEAIVGELLDEETLDAADLETIRVSVESHTAASS